LVFELAGDLTRVYASQPSCEVTVQVFFPQIAGIVDHYLCEKVKPVDPANILDVFLFPYYGWAIESLLNSIEPDIMTGETPEVAVYEPSRGPGSTSDIDFSTSKEVREVVRSHLNYIGADTRVWEQSAAYYIDTHTATAAFVKNKGLGFAIPYFHNGQGHDYIPDFIIRLDPDGGEAYLIRETKGFD
jgi:type III restriction enzyme